MKNLKIYCVTNKKLDFVSKSNYFFGWVGEEPAPKDYLTCNTQDNIFIKEKFYSELTFHYWYWKNQLKNENDTDWIGFCQKRRFWIKNEAKEKNINTNNANEFLVDKVEELPKNVESIICEPIRVNNVKKMKMIKRGIKSLIRNPSIFFDTSRQSIKFHFDMHHGYKNLEKAISIMSEKDRSEFLHYVENNISYNPHIMVISKKIFSLSFTFLVSGITYLMKKSLDPQRIVVSKNFRLSFRYPFTVKISFFIDLKILEKFNR